MDKINIANHLNFSSRTKQSELIKPLVHDSRQLRWWFYRIFSITCGRHITLNLCKSVADKCFWPQINTDSADFIHKLLSMYVLPTPSQQIAPFRNYHIFMHNVVAYHPPLLWMADQNFDIFSMCT